MIHRLCGIGGLVAFSALATLTSGSAYAAPALPAPENSLLGVRLMSRFSDVLKKFGQPNEIQVGAPVVPSQGANTAANGAAAGAGVPGMAGMPGGYPGMGGRMGGGMGGYPGMGGGPGGMPGMMGGGGAMMGGGMGMMTPNLNGKMGAMGGGYPGMGGGRGLPGFAGGQGGAGAEGGMPGFGGGPNFAGGANGGALGSGIAPGGGEAINTETTWWYHFPQQGVHLGFLFNRDGRVIQIQEYGWSPAKGIASATRQGITLGSTLGQIIRRYGWSSDGENTGENVTLRYGDKRRVGFQLVRNKVAGITLAVGE